jgi:hypothetical protein
LGDGWVRIPPLQRRLPLRRLFFAPFLKLLALADPSAMLSILAFLPFLTTPSPAYKLGLNTKPHPLPVLVFASTILMSSPFVASIP